MPMWIRQINNRETVIRHFLDFRNFWSTFKIYEFVKPFKSLVIAQKFNGYSVAKGWLALIRHFDPTPRDMRSFTLFRSGGPFCRTNIFHLYIIRYMNAVCMFVCVCVLFKRCLGSPRRPQEVVVGSYLSKEPPSCASNAMTELWPISHYIALLTGATWEE